jgi:hypothetical protein
VKAEIDDGNPSRPAILCLPARDEADEIAGTMLAQLLATSGLTVQSVSFTAAASELVELIERHQIGVVCVSATPPAAVMHARHLCKRLHGRFPEVHLVVGLWDAQGDLSKAKDRIDCGATVVATLADAQEHIRQLISLLLPHVENQAQPESGSMVKIGTP